MKFGVIADLQYCDRGPYIGRYPKNSIVKLREIIPLINSYNPDFILNLGDTIDKDIKSYDAVMPLFSEFTSPVYHVLGNHDFEVEEDAFDEVFSIFNIDKPGYYCIDLGAQNLIILNGNEISVFANKQESDRYEKAEKYISELQRNNKPNGNIYNGGISRTQMNWLEDQLSSSHVKNKPVIIACHYPIHPPSTHNLLNDDDICDLIKKYDNVLLWLCGHNHDGNYGLLKNCHVVNFKGLVDTEFENSFAIVEIDDNEIKIQGFGRELDRKLLIN